MEKNKPDHDCEFFLTTDVVVHSCECEHIEVSDKSISIEYVPLKKYQVLQSQLSEAEKRIKELEHQVMLSDTAAEVAQQLYEESQSQNERLLSALKENKEVLQWHLDKSVPYDKADQSDFFNNTANAITQSEQLINSLEKQ